MALTSSYLITVKNVKPFLDSLITAKAPNAFSQKFLEGLGFKSTNDRLFIPVLKGLGFLDSNGVPTERYFRFLDQSESKKVVAEGIEDAYGDLFAVNTKAYELNATEVKNKLRTLTQGRFSESVLTKMATTFKALTEYADWSTNPKPVEKKMKEEQQAPEAELPKIPELEIEIPTEKPVGAQFHYNIQIHLPESRDESVYDAIFRSLRRHLL